jgi:endonuclease YncB( thermonuclease family)
MYQYGAKVLKVVDGDTLHLAVDLGFGMIFGVTNEPFIARLAGINAPELSTAAGVVARQFVVDWLYANAPGQLVTVKTIRDKKEKYGRYLATIWTVPPTQDSPMRCLNDDLVASGNAVVYNP